MSIVKIEMLSNKNLKIGQILQGYFIEDKMYYSEMPLCDKYILRLISTKNNKIKTNEKNINLSSKFNENMESYGFASRETLFVEHSPRDIIQAMFDLKLDFNKYIEFEVLKIENINNNKKKLVILKLLDNQIASAILGTSITNKTSEIQIEKYLNKHKNIDNSINNECKKEINDECKKEINDECKKVSKEIILNVKGDVKNNPKRTTITRLLKNYEIPDIELAQDGLLNYRILYKGEFAGEVLDVPNDLELENVESIKCHSYISLGYTVIIKYKPVEAIKSETTVIADELSKNENKIEEVIKPSTKRFKADKDEIIKIVNYLNKHNIPEVLIDKILDSHEPFEEKYLKRIPHSSDDNFTPWTMTAGEKNLLLLAIAQIEEGFNLRFVGGKGVGKDTLSQTLCWIYQRPRYTQSASIDTDTSILIGDKDLEPKMIGDSVVQTIGFETGLLIEAMEVGGFYELGEGNSCRPGVLMSLHTILDSRKFIDVKGYKLVKAHERFSFILTMNIDYEGCNNLNQAFRDRFATIKFPPPKSIKHILKHTCSFAKDKDIDICDRVYKNILMLASDLQDDEVITIRGYIRTLQMAKYIPLSDALECCVVDNVSDDCDTSKRVRHIVENIVG